MRRKTSLTHEKLVEEARFILRNLQRNDVFGDRVQLLEAERVLEPSLTLHFSDYVGFLTKYGYLRVDPESRSVAVTGGGTAAVESEDAEFHARLARHFARELSAAAGRPRSEPTTQAISTFDTPSTTVVRARRPIGTEPPQLDEVLDRRYRRGVRLGQGAIGSVYRGRHVSVGRPIAIKEASSVFQYASYLRRDEIVRRLRTAVEAHAQLEHPHVVQILDQNPEREHPYFVMELASGGNLRQRLQAADNEQLELTVAVRVLLQVAHALRRAHEQGVLHLGLKPENILFDELGNVKLTDFGMARVLDHPEEAGPAPVLVGGNTVGYLAPERLQPGAPRSLAPSADIYALGIIFYEMIAGRLPGRRSPLPSKAREGVPESFDEVFDHMTRDELEERYSEVDEVLDGLHDAFGSDLVFEKGSIVSWAEDPGPIPPAIEEDIGGSGDISDAEGRRADLRALPELEAEPLDPDDFEAVSDDEPLSFESQPPAESGDIAGDLPVPGRSQQPPRPRLTGRPTPPPPPDE